MIGIVFLKMQNFLNICWGLFYSQCELQESIATLQSLDCGYDRFQLFSGAARCRDENGEGRVQIPYSCKLIIGVGKPFLKRYLFIHFLSTNIRLNMNNFLSYIFTAVPIPRGKITVLSS